MTWAIVQGDSRQVLAGLPDACIDAVITDPPYGLGKEPDPVELLRAWLTREAYTATGGGFMGKKWDAFVPGPEVWRQCLRVLKPGGHLLAFFGTRTYDVGTLAVRLAGFEIRDQLAWMYGTGMPKPANKKYFPKGWSNALKPAQEPIVLARKPLAGTVAANIEAYGTGRMNIDGCRVAARGRSLIESKAEAAVSTFGDGLNGSRAAGVTDLGRWPANVILDEDAGAMLDAQSGPVKGQQGRASTNGKMSISVARGPKRNHSDRPEPRGDSGGASRFFYCAKTSKKEREAGLEHMRKASAGELTGGRKEGSDGLKNPRAGAGRTSNGRANVHPTVKPIALMRYLVRLITPPGGRVLDPFAGSGTTIAAAVLEGMHGLGIELDRDGDGEPLGYIDIARARVAHWEKNRP